MTDARILQESTFKPSVDYKPHKNLEDDVTDYLLDKGFIVHQSTYHEVMPRVLARILSLRFSLTALYLRGRADRIAIHRELPIEFEWEAKTHARKDKRDLTIEALPLVHHMAKSRLGVDCLYAARVHGKDVGFWVSNLPEIKCVFLPLRKEYEPIRGRLKRYFEYYLEYLH